MGKKSKAKGSRGELEVARLVSAWWTGDESFKKAKAKDLPIRSTPQSGGWATGNGLKGDLVPVHESVSDFRNITVEVKWQENWTFDGLMRTGDSPVFKWWDQAVREAAANYSVPILVFRKNLHPWYVMINNPFAKSVGVKYKYCTSCLLSRGVVIMELESFFSQASRRTIMSTLEEGDTDD